MAAVSKDLPIEQGATFETDIIWAHGTVESPVPYDLTGHEIHMQIRETYASSVLVEATSANGKFTFIDAENGKFHLKLTPEDTMALTVATCLYDIEAKKTSSGDVYRIAKGKITVDPNVTRIE